MEHISLSAELGEIRYAIEGAHWIADSIAMEPRCGPPRSASSAAPRAQTGWLLFPRFFVFSDIE
ncbi:hypothetical protein JQX13_22755 [Archangium violaceum]|uniref:hypothetical protein n=1 Tax=Archangium violaceum TaxID=83451 RepID=UPI00193BD90F|nr:hypothetical protein [Archangium violaceum]QRK12599.1 hypothetical protein JQX13_22755 [Archangium violaceum]